MHTVISTALKVKRNQVHTEAFAFFFEQVIGDL